MNRKTQILLFTGVTVAITLLLTWLAVHMMVVRPAIHDRQSIRLGHVQTAAQLLQDGVSKREVEVSLGIDVRLFAGQPEGPPAGTGWIPLETPQGTFWKKEGGNYEIAAWTGHTWVAIQEHPPYSAKQALTLLTIALPVTLLMFGLSQRINRHQQHAEHQLARIAAGDLSETLDTQVGNRDVRRMAAAVNQMVTQLQALLKADRKQMAGLSHELRTPLTRIRLELDLARREGVSTTRLDRIERDIEDFDTMLQEMLDLSRLQVVGASTMACELVDLAGLTQLIVEEEQWHDVDIRGTGCAMVDRVLAARLIRNLLLNSAQHTSASQRWVSVDDDLIRIGDTGPGIPLEAHPHVLDAFHRGPSSTGHGLGLAIVAQIVALHGGTLSLSPPPGLVVTIRFPR